ncbi:MAG: hypothetical protein M1831_002239 [Alyxoria varia]|nr:MAG: hypothetical protein M1831_002239 [Alyxoria varia]
MTISKRTLEKFLDLVPWTKVYKKAGSTEKGQRLFPTGSNDPKYNFRIDKGAKINDNEHEIIVQANKNAADAGVKQSAQQDSHRVVTKAGINIKDENKEQAAEDLMDYFKKSEK